MSFLSKLADITHYYSTQLTFVLETVASTMHFWGYRITFMGDGVIKAIKDTVLRGMSKGFYSGVNFDLVICENCGNRPQLEVDVCPCCGSDQIMIQSRACGYISYKKVGGDTRFNQGKLAEMRDRVSM